MTRLWLEQSPNYGKFSWGNTEDDYSDIPQDQVTMLNDPAERGIENMYMDIVDLYETHFEAVRQPGPGPNHITLGTKIHSCLTYLNACESVRGRPAEGLPYTIPGLLNTMFVLINGICADLAPAVVSRAIGQLVYEMDTTASDMYPSFNDDGLASTVAGFWEDAVVMAHMRMRQQQAREPAQALRIAERHAEFWEAAIWEIEAGMRDFVKPGADERVVEALSRRFWHSTLMHFTSDSGLLRRLQAVLSPPVGGDLSPDGER